MSSVSRFLKRTCDLVAAVFLSPLVVVITLVIAILIRLLTGPQVIFQQEREGKGLRPFTLYKFRTMRADIDPFGPSPKTGSDPRLNRLGRFLRILSLDELPQLWNVLKGDMSLVGPRPLYLDQARKWNDRQLLRVKVKPGITGLAQIKGRGSLKIEDKLELDVQYVENQSLPLDAKIIILTLLSLFSRRNIYEKRYSNTEETRGPSS
ncbi:MAG: sugar transferase [Planctomycetes bacterium]|nr:sugar transferase [Planctomycetota bacterium]